jgi:hypothetical protein
MPYLIGAIGGLFACIGLLLTQPGNVLETYWINEAIRVSAFLGFGIRIVLFCALGAFWIYLNPQPGNASSSIAGNARLTVFQLGMAAPFAIGALFATIAAGEVDKASKAPELTNQTGQEQVGDAPSTFGGFWTGLLGKPLPKPLVVAALAEASQKEVAGSVAEQIANEAPEKFKGSERRSYSDALVELSRSTPQAHYEIVAGLFAALQTGGPYEYRINLYILRTLGSIAKWVPTPEQNAALAKLAEDPLAKDPTFKYWLEKTYATRQAAPRPLG